MLDSYRILNEDGLRYRDEFVKHKILDAIDRQRFNIPPNSGAGQGGRRQGFTMNDFGRGLAAAVMNLQGGNSPACFNGDGNS